MNRKTFSWWIFGLALVAFAAIQFIPSPPVIIPAELPADQREAHRLLNFGGVHNFRDLGGYRTEDGRQVRWGRLYRTSALNEATETDLKALQRLQLAYLVDFRSDAEKQEYPHRLPEPPGFEVVEVPVLDEGNNAMFTEIMDRIESGDFSGFDPDHKMVEANRQFAGQFTPEFSAFMRQVIEAKGAPVAWNCSAGKDRTGFAAAVLLRILGVPQETVMADYMASNAPSMEAHKSELRLLRLFKGEEAADKLGTMMGVEEPWLQAAFDEIDRHWGSFDRYVRDGLGLSAQDIAALRESLLDL